MFIYAAAVCRFIKEGSKDFPADNLLRLFIPDKPMTDILLQRSRSISTESSPTKELDMIYTQVLEHSLKNRNEDEEQLAAIFRHVVGAIVILFDPLSYIAISRLLNMDDRLIKLRLNHLRSVLEVLDEQEHSIRLLHPSFRGFSTKKDVAANSSG